MVLSFLSFLSTLQTIDSDSAIAANAVANKPATDEIAHSNLPNPPVSSLCT